LSEPAGRNPLALVAIIVIFVVALGLAAWGLNNVVNPSTPSTSGFAPAQANPCGEPSSGHPAKNPVRTYPSPPSNTLDSAKGYTARMCTSKGLITIPLRAAQAPTTVNSFVFLANQGFFDGLIFHRVCPNPADSTCGTTLHIAQGGDPQGSGRGGPGFSFADETPVGGYTAGTLAMANSGANTNGSQFFINTADNPLPPKYNIFGDISTGLDVANSLVRGDKILWVDIVAGAPLPPITPGPVPSPLPSPSPSI
jgi:cyclophilin family peptidyl-prolyl cis-trans isomerase